MSAMDMHKQAKSIGGFTGFGSPGRSSTGTVAGLLSPDDYLEMWAQDANINDLNMLSQASEGGLMGMLTHEPTIENPYKQGHGASAEEVADFNKRYMQKYGVRSGDLLGLEEALRQGDVSKIMKNVEISPAQYDEKGKLVSDAEFTKVPYISYVDRSGESPVNREFRSSVLSDYETLPEDEFKARYKRQFGGLGEKFTSVYDTFGDSQFHDLLEDYLPYATGQETDYKGTSLIDYLSGTGNNMEGNVFQDLAEPVNQKSDEMIRYEDMTQKEQEAEMIRKRKLREEYYKKQSIR